MTKTKLLIAAVAVTSLLGLSACGSDDDDKNPKPQPQPQPECSTSADCDDGFVCSDEGACVPEEEPVGCDPACTGETPICIEETGTCVACTANDHCGEGEVCNLDTNTCVTAPECTTSDDCDEGVCDLTTGTCVTCTATEGCDTGVCDTSVAGGACVGCLDGDDCATGWSCDAETRTCVEDVECRETADCETGVCDTENNVCATCTATEGCADGLVCDTSVNGGRCVECLDDAQCAGEGSICLADNTCGSLAQRTAQQIAAVLATPNGNPAQPLPVTGATVTYLKKTLGSELGGFFVQALADGPAVFVESNEVVSVGDVVDFYVTGMDTVSNSVRKVVAMTGFEVVSSGADVSLLVQDVSNADDLVSNLAGYEAELVRITGTITGAFGNGGATHRAAVIETAAITGNDNLKIRIAPDLEVDYGLVPGCQFTLVGPVWKFGTQVQISAYEFSDFESITCPATKVVSAAATSGTEILLTFDRAIAPASVLADGSQFTFDNGLTATAATVNGKTVTVTTSAQQGNEVYTVTVANTVLDVLGGAVDSAVTAQFTGFEQPAILQINELNHALSGSRDLLELFVVQGGPLNGMKVVANKSATAETLLATLPDVTVATGDYIVIHFSSSITAETTSKNEGSGTDYIAGAWDFPAASGADIKNSSAVIAIVDPADRFVDVVSFANSNTPPAAWLPAFQYAQAQGAWLPADCAGATCDTAGARALSVNWTQVNSNGSNSLQRIPGANTRTKDDWLIGSPASWGAANTVGL